MNCLNYNKILHLLAGIAIGFLLFGCKTPKPSCDAYAYLSTQTTYENQSRK